MGSEMCIRDSWQDEFGEFETPDGVAFMDRNIDTDELDAMLEDDF